MMRTTVPTPGVNELTRRLLAQGVRPDDHSTWPEGVWKGDGNNFLYSREWRFTPTWESPCGLLIHDHGDHWGDTWVDGEFKCAENDNPLFACPMPGKPCEHRLKLPAGMNCQFHRTEREWNEEDSVERLTKLRNAAIHEQWEYMYYRFPDWDGICPNLRTRDLPDGSVETVRDYNVEKCIGMHCKSKQCACRLGAARDVRPANIYYDLYLERRYSDDLVPHVEKTLTKGLKVFDRPVARTDAEICLKVWRHDPDARMLPGAMGKLNAGRNIDRKEDFFVRIHRYWDGHRNVELYAEIWNIRVAKSDARDMLADLQAVRDGIAVEHQSDKEKAAKEKKTRARFDGKVRKTALIVANERERGSWFMLNMIAGEKPEFKEAVKAEAERILEKRRKAREKQAR